MSESNYNTSTTAAETMSVKVLASSKPLATKEDRSEVDVVVNRSNISLESTCLKSVDSDPSLKKSAKLLDKKEDKSKDVLRRELLSELNNNSLSNPVVTSNDVLAPEKDRSRLQNGTSISGKTKEESCSTSSDAQVPFEPSRKGSEPKRESHQEVSVVSKCE